MTCYAVSRLDFALHHVGGGTPTCMSRANTVKCIAVVYAWAMFLKNVENHQSQSPWGEAAAALRGASMPVPQIFHLFNYKPHWTKHLAAFTQAVMRGPSPLAPGERELIAAFTSRLRNCVF